MSHEAQPKRAMRRTFFHALMEHCEAERAERSEVAQDARVKVILETQNLLAKLACTHIRSWDLRGFQDEARRLLLVYPCAFRLHESLINESPKGEIAGRRSNWTEGPTMRGAETDLTLALEKLHQLALEDGDLGYAYWYSVAELLRSATAMQARVDELERQLNECIERSNTASH